MRDNAASAWYFRGSGRIQRLAAWGLAKARVGNPITTLYGIHVVRQDDIYIASYPRSGNTWMRYVLAYLSRGTGAVLDARDVGIIAPDAYNSPEIINRQSSGRLIKIHEPFLRSCPRVIYVHRDYRSAAVSYWHFLCRTEAYRGTFSDFLRSSLSRRHGSWKQHMLALKDRLAIGPSTIHVIRYEDLIGSFQSTVASLVAWSGIGHGVDLASLQQLTSLDQMGPENRRQYGVFSDAGARNPIMDKARVVGWRRCWSQEDLDWLRRDRTLMALMGEFGYDWS